MFIWSDHVALASLSALTDVRQHFIRANYFSLFMLVQRQLSINVNYRSRLSALEKLLASA
jgi:hypothetical protein